MKSPSILASTRAYLSRQLRRPKVLVAVLVTMACGFAAVLIERHHLQLAHHLERQRDDERGREQLLLRPVFPEKLSFDVQRGLRLTTFDLSITNTSEADIVIDTGHFFKIRGMEDDGGMLYMTDDIVQVRIVDAATGQEMPSHRRLLPKEIIDLRVETTRQASTKDVRTVLQAQQAGRVHQDWQGILEVPFLDIPRPSLRMDLEPGDLVVYLGVGTSLGHSDTIRLGGI